MASGRCAGCGLAGTARRVSAHQMGCAPYIAAYQASPESVLGPEAEHERWLREDKECGRSGRKDRIAAAMQDTLNARIAANARFARLPDVLED